MKTRNDVQLYRHLSSRMRGMMLLGLRETPEFRNLWQELETVKNRHGGMPPLPHLQPLEPLATITRTPQELRILGRLL